MRNGDTGTVTRLGNGYLNLTLTDGTETRIKQDSRAAEGIDHAHALTGHDYQGATVDRIIIAMNANENLADQKSFYVAASRARDEVILKTDDVTQLATRLEKQTGQTVPALEAWVAQQIETARDAREAHAEARNARADKERSEAHKEPQNTPKQAPEKETQDRDNEAPERTLSKAERMLLMATPEEREAARQIVE